MDDGCLENTPDTAEFSREYQLHQHLFDPEHNYPNTGKWVSTCFLVGLPHVALGFVAWDNGLTAGRTVTLKGASQKDELALENAEIEARKKDR